MDKDKLVFSIVVASIIYIIILGTKEIINKVYNKSKVKKTRESIIKVTIKDKYHWEASSYQPGVRTFCASPKLPDCYIVDCVDMYNKEYSVSDKDIFENHKIGDSIRVKLIEKLDENNIVISYEVEKLV